MSIVTKKGDQGTTGLMYGRRVSKTEPRIEACGAVDELNAALGFARASTSHEPARTRLAAVQKDLVSLMGELATLESDRAKYIADGYAVLSPRMTARLEDEISQLESLGLRFDGWATPGANLHAAALDLARTVCRRAERAVCGLKEAGQLSNVELIIYLNRLSDLLWLLARQAEGATQG